MKYFVSYKYHRMQEEVNENNEKVLKQWDSYSNDVFDIDFSINNLDDIRTLENYIYNVLKKECEVRNQDITALLLLSFNKLED